jgi:hypothetical protein
MATPRPRPVPAWWSVRNSTLWRFAAFFWLMNALLNGVTAANGRMAPVYLALCGINLLLMLLCWWVSCTIRRTVARLAASSKSDQHAVPNTLRTQDEPARSV